MLVFKQTGDYDDHVALAREDFALLYAEQVAESGLRMPTQPAGIQPKSRKGPYYVYVHDDKQGAHGQCRAAGHGRR